MDARSVIRPDRRGIGKATLQLYQTLLSVRPNWRVTAFYQPGAWCRDERLRDQALGPLPERFQPVPIDMPGDRFGAWSRLRLPLAVSRSGADMFHGPANQACPLIHLPAVVTIHDLIPLTTANGLDYSMNRTFARHIRNAVAAAKALVTPSHYTRDLLVDHMKAAPQRTRVIPWGPPSRMKLTSTQLREDVLQLHRVDRPYVLHFGALEPRKNTRLLIEAWHLLSQAMRQKYQLLIIGLDAEAQRVLHHVCDVDTTEVNASIQLNGFVNECVLPVLLDQALCLAYPSRDEGFGLPILEAMRVGTPVICGDRTAVCEVAGDAACQVDIDHAESIAVGLREVLTQASYREKLMERGYANVERFDWQRSAEQMAGVLDQCLERRERRAA